jgi:hypothetical protein
VSPDTDGVFGHLTNVPHFDEAGIKYENGQLDLAVPATARIGVSPSAPPGKYTFGLALWSDGPGDTAGGLVSFFTTLYPGMTVDISTYYSIYHPQMGDHVLQLRLTGGPSDKSIDLDTNSLPYHVVS